MKIKSLLLLGLLTMTGMNAFAADAYVNSNGVRYHYDDAATASGAKVYAVVAEGAEALTIVKDITVGDLTLKVVDFEAGWENRASFQNVTGGAKSLTINIDNFNASLNGDAFTNLTVLESLTLKGTSTINGDYVVPKFTNATIKTLNYAELAAKDGKKLQIASYTGDANIESITVPAAMEGVNFSNSGNDALVVSGIKLVSASAFEGSKVKTVTFAEGATIGKDAFKGAATLTSIDLTNVTSIGEGAFRDCSALATVNLGSLDAIPAYAFNNDDALATFAIPATVKTIGVQAFAYCDNLVPNFATATELTKIEGEAFKGDAKITAIDLSAAAKLAEVGNNAFPAETAYTSVKLAGTALDNANFEYAQAWLAGSKASLTEITFPAALTAIGGFEGFTALESVTLPENLETIADDAFKSSGLKSIAIPAKVKTIGKSAFEYSAALATADFSGASALETIGNSSFASTALTAVVIPASVKTIEQYAFANNAQLASLDFSGATGLETIEQYAFKAVSPELTAINLNGATALATVSDLAFDKDAAYTQVLLTNTKLTAVPTCFLNDNAKATLAKLGLPAAMETVAGLAGLTALKNIDLPKNATAIAADAFNGCTALESIVIPAKVETIGSGAFLNCSALASVDFSGAAALTTIGHSAFAYTNLASVKIPAKLEVIDESVFANNALLETVDFSAAAALTEIKANAFNNDPKMLTIDLDGATSLTSVANNAFPKNEYTSVKANNTALAGRTNPEDPASYYDHFSEPFSAPFIMEKAYNQDGSLEITLPKGLETVKPAQFKLWTALKSISLPKAVSEIGANAFEGSGLTGIKIRENVATIGESAFQGCAALTLVNLSEATKLEEIGKKVFADCAALESVDFAGATALKTIGESAFNGCGLTGVKVTGTIETIATQAFYNNKLESVDFSEAAALTTIGDNAFGVALAENSKFTTLDLSGATALTTVAANAFPQNAYTSVKLDGIDKDAVNAAFNKDDILKGSNESLTEITFPADYDMASFDEFPYFENLTAITLPADATEIPDNAFKGANITSFEVSDKIVRIGKNAFDGSALESIDFTKATALETIDNYAFANTAKLEAVVLPKNLEVIPENAFENSGLKAIKIRSNVKTIGAYAFNNCKDLETVNFSEAGLLETIGGNAFGGTNKLTAIDLDGAVKLTSIEDSWGVAFAANEYTSVKTNGTLLAGLKVPEDETTYYDNFSSQFTAILANSKESLTEVTLPAGLKEIVGNPAGGQFAEFTALKQISLPKAVENIGEKAFFKSGLTVIKIRENVKEIGAKAFAGCKDLATANLADAAALETIGDGAFAASDIDQKDAPVITTVVIPAKVNTIGLAAFYNCEKLANVDFSQAAALTTIGNLAFAGTAITAIDLSGCAELATISGETFPKNKYTKLLLGGTKLDESKIVLIDLENATETLAEATLPAGITYVPQNFFGQFRYGDRMADPVVKKPFSKLTSVSLPKSVAVIQDGAFAGAGLTAFKFRENIEAIEEAAFADCANLATLNFSEATKLQYIGASAFLRAGVTEAIIPENADGNALTIGPSAFRDSKLKSFSAKSWTGVIAPKTFQNTKLNGIKIPATITGIGEEAFDGCKKLGTVTFLHAKKAEKISFIGNYAFRNCEALEALDLSNTKLEKIVSTYPFEGCTALATITFPEELTSLNSDYLFADCPIENFEAPNLTESAVLFGYYREFDEEDGSFLGYEQRDKDHANTTLKTVKMGGPIEEGCFAFCTSLESVEWLGVESVPDGSIGSGSAMPSYASGPVEEGAFAYCTALKTFTYLPESPITELMVSDDAFVGCTPYVMFVTNRNYLDWIVANYRGAAPVNATFGDNIDITKVKTVQDKANAKQFVGKYVNNSATPVYIDANEAKAYSIYVDGDKAYFQACRTFNGYYIIEPQMTFVEGGGVDGSDIWTGTPGIGSHVILKTDEAKEIEIHQLTMTDAIKLDLARYMMSYGPGAGLRQSSIAYDDVYDSQKDDDLARVQHYAGVSAGSYLYRLTNTAGQGFGFTAFTGSTIKEGQFFVACEAKPAGAGRLAEVWLDEDGKVISGDVTGIESVEKIDVNNGAIYNLQGVRVDNPVKGGLYIQNGKKIVVK